ncbi:MAG: DAK2 domain-containing protein [Acidimicrobiales bacterium]
MNGLAGVIDAVCAELVARADELNRLDAVAGDGDLGVTATNMASAVLEHRDAFAEDDLAEALSGAGRLVAERAPSTAGTLIASALIGAGRAVAQAPADPALRLAELLTGACSAIVKRGKAERGARTMLDALGPASDAATSVAARGGSVAEVLEVAAQAANEGAEATAQMAARFGRASWLPERAVGQIDAGARLIAIILDAAARAVGPPHAERQP